MELPCHVGMLPLNTHKSAVELLLLAHKFIVMVRIASEPMKSTLVRHLYPELEGVKQDGVQKLSKVCTCNNLNYSALLLMQSLDS